MAGRLLEFGEELRGEGVLVVRDERPPVGSDGKEPPAPDRWWVLQDRPALSGTDLKNPEQNFENGTGGAPIGRGLPFSALHCFLVVSCQLHQLTPRELYERAQRRKRLICFGFTRS